MWMLFGGWFSARAKIANSQRFVLTVFLILTVSSSQCFCQISRHISGSELEMVGHSTSLHTERSCDSEQRAARGSAPLCCSDRKASGGNLCFFRSHYALIFKSAGKIAGSLYSMSNLHLNPLSLCLEANHSAEFKWSFSCAAITHLNSIC